MHLLHSRHTWTYRMGFERMIDFCIWALEVDGLHVTPFDQHEGGDASLRAAGLTAEDWQSWFLAAFHDQAEFERALRQRSSLDLTQGMAARRLPAPPSPSSAWGGDAAVRERLVVLWEQYNRIADHREAHELQLQRALQKAERQSGVRLYDELRPYQTQIPPLSIYLVVYSQPLDYLLPPATLLMTVREGQPTHDEFRERVLAAALELATPPGRRRSKSPYIRVAPPTSSVALAYRMHPRRPAPPAPSRPEISRLADPARQVVLDYLASDHSPYGIIDPGTLQFRREKNRPSWRFYETSFAEVDGEQHRGVVFILQQNQDGSWHQCHSSSGGDTREVLSSLMAPVRDHPLIFLSTSTSSDADGQHLFLAYGDVIDNGFRVERVRLVTTTGQVFEDRVEEGSVMFAVEQTQPMPLPIRAELYNDEGKLVWQQPVPDQGPPFWLMGGGRRPK